MDTTKFLLIFKREYITRVRTKAFILSTILAPVGLLILIIVPIVLNLMQTEQRHIIGIQDETSTVLVRLMEQNPDRYEPLPPVTADSLRSLVRTGKIDGYIILTEEHISGARSPELFYTGTGGLSLISEIRGDLRAALQNERLDRAEVGDAVRDILAMRTSLQTRVLTETGEQESDTMSLFFVGYIMFFIIYAAMFGYGAVIMRSVIEEKSNRIIEVITSSVRPFELLLGKVTGVGALGLTQFAIWSVTGAGLMALAAPMATLFMGAGQSADASTEAAQADLPFTLPSIGLEVWVVFILFFLAGYLIYSSMYAAVGSAVDAESDANQLMIPLMIPIMLPLLFIGNVASDPNSTLSVVTSLVPFFAPMIMPMRVAMTPVPFWEIALSLTLCIATFIAIIWLSARIYRVGILMYGKKASFGELFKWVRFN